MVLWHHFGSVELTARALQDDLCVFAARPRAIRPYPLNSIFHGLSVEQSPGLRPARESLGNLRCCGCLFLENIVSDGVWVALVGVALLLASSCNLWLRLKTFTTLRPWLVRHTIGTAILAVAFLIAWFFAVGPAYYLLVACGGFVIWMLGNRKLRAAARERH